MTRKTIETDGYNAVTQWKYGYLVYNKNDEFVGKSVEKYGEFSEGEVELFRQLCKPGDVVVEVGANIGAHTVALSQIVGSEGEVIAFEPQRIVYYTLCANVAINSIENILCHHMAVGAADGFVTIPEMRYDQPGNFGGVEVGKSKTGEQVRRVKLDSVIDVPSLKLLKVDVEGMESEVIRGAKKLIARHRPVLYVENDRAEKSKELIELIKSLDYRLFWHLPQLFNPNNYAGDKEDIYPGLLSGNMLCFHKSAGVNLEGFREIEDSSIHPLTGAGA